MLGGIMMNKKTITDALTKIGATDEQTAVFLQDLGGKALAEISENDVSAELEKLGITGEQALADFYAAVKEPQIMDQELDLDELEAVAGGDCSLRDQEADQNCCVKDHYRWYHRHGCAATVEVQELLPGQYAAQGTCSNNDKCQTWAVVYYMTD